MPVAQPLRIVLLASAVLLLAAAPFACGAFSHGANSQAGSTPVVEAPAEPDGVFGVGLMNWMVMTRRDMVPAGVVTFRATHMTERMDDGTLKGGKTHDLEVARKLPGGEYEIAGSTGEIPLGEQRTLTLTLPPGQYELRCSLTEGVSGTQISHYTLGMHTALVVK